MAKRHTPKSKGVVVHIEYRKPRYKGYMNEKNELGCHHENLILIDMIHELQQTQTNEHVFF